MPSPRSWPHLTFPLFLPSFLGALLLGIVAPVLPLYLKSEGASLAVIGTVVSARALGGLIFGLPGSGLLARFSMRRAMLGGLTVAASCLIAMSQTASAAGLFTLWLLVGMSLSLFEIGRHQFIAAAIDPAMRGRSVSILGGLGRLANTIGPAAGGFLAREYGFQLPFWVMAALALASAGVLYLFLPEIREPGGGADFSLGRYWRELKETGRQYRHVLIAAGAAQLTMQMVRQSRQVIIPLYAAIQLGFDVADVGYILSIGSAFDTAFFWMSGILMDRLGRKAAIIPGLMFQLVGFVALPFTAGFAGLATVVAFLGFGNGITSGTMLTLGADLAPVENRVPFLGIWRLSSSLGFTLGPNAVGWVADLLSLTAASFSISGLALAGIFLFWRFVPETLRKGEKKVDN